jgi:hypothetical protein
MILHCLQSRKPMAHASTSRATLMKMPRIDRTDVDGGTTRKFRYTSMEPTWEATGTIHKPGRKKTSRKENTSMR